jgi:hypothetical protein
MSREYTGEECQEMLLKKIASLSKYWAEALLDDFDSKEEEIKYRLNGFAFSVLNIFDGSSMDLPAFDIFPSPHPSDKEYFQDNDENWFPGPIEVCRDVDGNDLVAINGMMHEQWGKYK